MSAAICIYLIILRSEIDLKIPENRFDTKSELPPTYFSALNSFLMTVKISEFCQYIQLRAESETERWPLTKKLWMATVQEGVSNLVMFLSFISIIGPHSSPQFMKSNCLAFNYSFSVRDSMEGWREAVLAVDAFLGWKQVLASFSFNPDFFSPGVAPSGDCRHHHSSLFDHLVHRSVPLNQYQ